MQEVSKLLYPNRLSANERMKLNDTIISQVLNKISTERSNWEKLITDSFLSKEMKEKYLELINKIKEVIEV